MKSTLQISIIEVEDEAAIILPPELLSVLRVALGDVLEAELTEGGVRLTRRHGASPSQMAVAGKVMAQRRTALRALAAASHSPATIDAMETIMAEDAEILRALASPPEDGSVPSKSS